MAIPISEYRDLCCTLQTLTASQSSLAQEMAAIRARQEQMLTTQAQHTAILSQQSNASNGVQFGAEMKELQPLEAEHYKLKANFAALRNQPFAAK